MKNINDRLKKLEGQYKVSQYVPVLFLNLEGDLQDHEHQIGFETVVFIDDIQEQELVE